MPHLTQPVLQLEAAHDPRLIGQLFESFPHDVAVIGLDGSLLAANQRWLTAQSDPVLPGTPEVNVLDHLASVGDRHTAIAEHLRDGLTRVLRGRSPGFELQYEVRVEDAPPRWFLVAATALHDGGAVVTHTDTTVHHSVQDVLAELAFHDTLTGLPNRTLVLDRIRTALVRAQRTSAFPAVLFIDLDGFKAVNDTYGHAVGDQVLIEAARRLSGAVREGDTCGRWGGDEFVLVVDLTNPATIEGLIQRAQRAFARPIVVEGGIDVAVGLSIGVVLSQRADEVEQLVRRADEAMYSAKRSGSGVEVVDAAPSHLAPPVIRLP